MLIDFRQLFPKYGMPKGVLHIGAHHGQEAEAYHSLGIENMVLIEADPETFQVLLKNVDKYSKAVCINVALSDEEAMVDFNIASNQGQSSSLLDFGTHTIAHPEVKFIDKKRLLTKRLDQICNEEFSLSPDVDFLNIDVQGAELKVLKGMGDLLKQFKWVYLEVNEKELYKGCPHINDLDLFLTGFHFRRVETKMFSHWGWGDALYIK